MDITYEQIADFPLLSINVMRTIILGEINTLILSLFDIAFMYWKRSLVGETFSPEMSFLVEV